MIITFILLEFSLGYLGFGFYILFKNKSSLTNRMLFSFCIHLSCWALGDAFMITEPTPHAANIWRLVSAFGWCFVYSVWLDFAVLLRKEDKKWMSSIKRLFIYIPPIVFFIATFRYDPNEVFVRVNGLWEDVYPMNYFEIAFIVYYIAFTLAGMVTILKWGKKSSSKAVKKQSKIIFLAALITFIIGACIDTIFPFFDIYILFSAIVAFPIAMFGIWYAITKYKMMSITSEIASEYIMDTINNPVIIVGSELSVKYVNQSALEFIGYDRKELDGMSMHQFMPITSLNQIAFREFINVGYVKNIEVKILTKSNKYVTCLVSASSIYNEAKELIGIVGVWSDITDRKNAENILLKAHQELELEVAKRTAELKKSNALLQAEITERKKIEERNQQIVKMEALGTLAGGIAHDFNNILAGIMGYTQLTLEDLNGEVELQDNLLEVLKLGERAKKLISQILTFSRSTIINPELVDMRVIIEEIVKMIKTTSTTTSLQVIYDFNGNWPYVFADPGEMQQLIMNLCVNAQLAMANKVGILQVIMTEAVVDKENRALYQNINQGKYIKIQVIDNGCGMREATIKRIFEPFYTTREVHGGTGLGLSVVHGIIRRYAGLITVDSKVNIGSVFTIFLPEAKANLNCNSGEENPTNRSSARILFVDDEEVIVNTTKKILQREGYIVTGVMSGEAALTLFRDNVDSFDIIITDQSMPDMMGSVLIQEVKQIRTNIPVILCSGYIQEMDDEKIKSLGIEEFLFKPVSKNEYINAIEKAINDKS